MPSPTDVQLCPECRAEYTLAVTRCAECDVALVAPHAVPEEQAPEALPPVSELACVRVAPLAWMRALSGGLQELGVTHRIEPAQAKDAPPDQRPDVFGGVQLFGLYVRPEDLERAQGLDGQIAAQLLPEEAPALDEGEQETCPACDTPLGEADTECSDCGLQFG